MVSVRVVSVDILPDSLPLTFRPHHADDLGNAPPRWTSPDHAKTQRDAARRRDQKNQSQRRRRAELKDSPDHRALINQSQRRRRAELTPSNQDLDKAQNTQSKRRRRAELSPEDAQRRKAMDTLWRRRLNSARAAGRGRVLESMS